MISLDFSTFHIGIVCALPKELAAVLAVLDEEYERPAAKYPQDDNTYVLGRIHKHNVVIACLPVRNYGTASAATVAKDLLRTYHNVHLGLMVGIGGGIPYLPTNDIRLGDVVVSQPDGVYAGAAQYNLAKSLNGGKFERKVLLNQPPKALRTALSLSQAKQAGIGTYLLEAYAKDPALIDRGYGHPGVENDELFCRQCESTQYQWWWQRLSRPSCVSCKNGIVFRNRRTLMEPLIHYGIIASGNSVIKDAAFRDHLGQELQAKCVEMDAAGLMNSFPCIVVRGICDYADSHKNDVWQEYASLSAAACAKELLSWLPPEQVETTNTYPTDKHQKCHQAFKTSTYETFKNINPERVPGTC